MINIKNIINTDNIILVISVIFLLIAGIFLFVIVLINNCYVKKNKNYFMSFFYGENNDSVNIYLEESLNAIIYMFFLLYFLYSINMLKNVKDVFPSKLSDVKAFDYFPNVYKEDLPFFLKKHNKWIKINLFVFIFSCSVFIWLLVYVFIIGVN